MSLVCLRCHQLSDPETSLPVRIGPETKLCPICGVPRPAKGWPSLPGEWRPGLWLERQIAVGGMGAVYLARQYESWEARGGIWSGLGRWLRGRSAAPGQPPDSCVEVALKLPILVQLNLRREALREGRTLNTLLRAERGVASKFLAELDREYAAGFHLKTVHEQVVQVYETRQPLWSRRDGDEGPVAWLDDPPYMVMEYVNGWTFDQIRKEQPGRRLPPLRAALLMEAASRALARVHERNVVHRDVKPGNLFVLREPGQEHWPEPGRFQVRVKVADFGLARIGPTEPPTAQAAGTPTFMAPEQFTNYSGVDPRADLYGLGAILHLLLTGESPIHREPGQDWSQAHLSNPIRPDPLIPEGLLAIIRRCLAKQPAERYGSGDELADALQHFASQELGRYSTRLEQFQQQRIQMESRLRQLDQRLEEHAELVRTLGEVLAEVRQAPTSPEVLADSDWLVRMDGLVRELPELEKWASELLRGAAHRPAGVRPSGWRKPPAPALVAPVSLAADLRNETQPVRPPRSRKPMLLAGGLFLGGLALGAVGVVLLDGAPAAGPSVPAAATEEVASVEETGRMASGDAGAVGAGSASGAGTAATSAPPPPPPPPVHPPLPMETRALGQALPGVRIRVNGEPVCDSPCPLPWPDRWPLRISAQKEFYQPKEQTFASEASLQNALQGGRLVWDLEPD